MKSTSTRRRGYRIHLVAAAALAATAPAVQAAETVRFATFNASLNRNNAGELISDLSTPDNPQAKNVAEIIQRVNPDVIFINEFDFDAGSAAVQGFLTNYLGVSQRGQTPVQYDHVFVAPSNTGIPSGFDLDNNGSVGGGNDAFGFGAFEGQFGMVLLSKFPIQQARTFQNFLWRDMPNALLPDDPNTAEPNDWFSPEELDVVRLSSKSHWDVALDVNGTTVHALAAHPTPPVFDGAEDRNGTRNHDEIRFWADYVTPGGADYATDDNGQSGGLAPGDRFVILGDYNADPFDGDSTQNAILPLLNHPLINSSPTTGPTSEGGPDAAQRQGASNNTHTGNPALDTADFADTTPGNLRADYVLPSANMTIADQQVFWTTDEDPLFDLIGDFDFNLLNQGFPTGYPASDHRLVFADIVVPEPTTAGVVALIGLVTSAMPRRRRGS